MNAFLYGLGNGISYGLMNTLNCALFGSFGGFYGCNPFMFGPGCCCGPWNANSLFIRPMAMGSGIPLSPTVSLFC